MVNQPAQSLPRRAVRQAIGYALLGPRFIVGKFDGVGTVTTGGDTSLRGGDDTYNGYWIVFHDGADEGDVVSVTDFDETGGALEQLLTFTPANDNTDTTAVGASYELWPSEIPPEYIDNLIDQAVIDSRGVTYHAEEDFTLHLHPDDQRYPIPDQFSMINKLERRVSLTSIVLRDCDAVWGGDPSSGFTEALDDQIKRLGGASIRCTIASSATANTSALNANATGPAVDISNYNRAEFWFRSSIDLEQNAFGLLFQISFSNPIATVPFPPMKANIWTFLSVPMDSPSNILEVGTAVDNYILQYLKDGGAAVAWIDDLRAVQSGRDMWARINPREWYIDKEAREIVFKNRQPYQRLKITGGHQPHIPSRDFPFHQLENCDVVWATIHANTTGTADTDVVKEGKASLKLVTGDQADGEVLAQQTINPFGQDISGFTHIAFWIRSTAAIATDVMQLVLKEESTERERLSIKAVITADTWEYQTIPLLTPASDNLITILVIEANHVSAIDTKTVYFDDIRAVNIPDTTRMDLDDQYIIDWVLAALKMQDPLVSATEKTLWMARRAAAKGGLRHFTDVRKI